MKSLDATYLTKLQAQQNKPVLLYELYLGSGTLRLCDWNQDIIFPIAGSTYTAFAIRFERLQQAGGDKLDNVSIEIDNVGQVIGAYAAHERFRGRTIVIKRVFADTLGSADYSEIIFAGQLQEPVIDHYKVVIEATTGRTLRTKQPLTCYQRLCRHDFGDTYCNADGTADITTSPRKETGTATGGSSTTLQDTDNGDLSGEADYYQDGWLICEKTIDGHKRIETRRITAYDETTKTFTIALPFSWTIDTDTTYVVIAGCDKTWSTCYSKWSNSLNYGGFLHV